MNAQEGLRPIPETHCRILGNMQGPEGKSYLVAEIITDTTPEQTARDRDEVVIERHVEGDTAPDYDI